MSDNNDNNQWYTNKDLHELISDLQKDMIETRNMIRQYNGLYTKLGDVRADVDEIKAQQKGRKSVGDGIKSWGGWVISIIMMLIALSQFL